MSNNIHTSLFDLSSIHQRYWKDFCDVCYSRFGFEQGEVRTYEQKYDTFCRCKNYVTSEEGYEEQLLITKEEDLKRLQSYAEWFFGIDDAYDILPALYNLVWRDCRAVTSTIARVSIYFIIKILNLSNNLLDNY